MAAQTMGESSIDPLRGYEFSRGREAHDMDVAVVERLALVGGDRLAGGAEGAVGQVVAAHDQGSRVEGPRALGEVAQLDAGQDDAV